MAWENLQFRFSGCLSCRHAHDHVVSDKRGLRIGIRSFHSGQSRRYPSPHVSSIFVAQSDSENRNKPGPI